MQQHFTVQSHPSFPFALFPAFPSSCPRAGLKSWKKAVSVPSQRPPGRSPLSSGLLCLMQGVTAGEEPALSSMHPKPGANSPCWLTRSWHGNYFQVSSRGSPGVVGFALLGVFALLSFSPYPEPLLCLCCFPFFSPPVCTSKYATKPWDCAVS